MLTANILSWRMGWFSTFTASLQSVFTFFYGHFYWRRISEYLLHHSPQPHLPGDGSSALNSFYLVTGNCALYLRMFYSSDQTPTKPQLPTSKLYSEGKWSLQLKWPRLIRLGWPAGARQERIRTSAIPSMCTCQRSGPFLSAGMQVACSLDANHTVPQPVFHGI